MLVAALKLTLLRLVFSTVQYISNESVVHFYFLFVIIGGKRSDKKQQVPLNFTVSKSFSQKQTKSGTQKNHFHCYWPLKCTFPTVIKQSSTPLWFPNLIVEVCYTHRPTNPRQTRSQTLSIMWTNTFQGDNSLTRCKPPLSPRPC